MRQKKPLTNEQKIEKSEFVKELWTSYSEKHQYAKDIEFEKVMEKINDIKKII